MRVISYGVSIKAGNRHISVAQLFASMKLDNGKEDISKGTPRLFYIDDDTDKNFYRGLVVTVRDQNAFCKLVKSGSNFKIQVQNLENAEKIMDFNMFVIGKENGLGIYQYYHHSCSTNTFLQYLKRKYRALSNQHMEGILADMRSKGEVTNRQERNLRVQYRDPLEVGVLVRPESLESVLAEYEQVRGFSFELVSLQARRRAAGPLDPIVTKVHQTVSFVKDLPKSKISEAITSYLGSINRKTARVAVIDEDEESFSLRIADIPANFGESEYDEIAAELEGLDVSKFSTHSIVAGLRKTCLKHSDVFMAETEE